MHAALAAKIRRHLDEIVARWTDAAARSASAHGLSEPQMHNVMPVYVSAIADVVEDGETAVDAVRKHVESHLATRARQGFDLAETVSELVLLDRIIIRYAGTTDDEGDRVGLEIERATAAVAEMFHKHMNEDEQSEKRFLRRIQQVATDTLRTNEPSFGARLQDILAIVCEAMDAQSAALFLLDATSRELRTAASYGEGGKELERHVVEQGASSLVATIADSEEATAILDVETTALGIGDVLRKSGIHAVVGVRLPQAHRLLGVMYVCFRERRDITAREARRLETLGEWIALHLDNDALFVDVQHKLDVLEEERELRERFVAVVAHDLRGPLTAARMSADIVRRRPERAMEASQRLDRSLERIERMIVDLLDANRLFAGQSLPLDLARCELQPIVADVVTEAEAQYGPRFAVSIEPNAPIEGVWGAPQLRRALWNLVSNAVKYGDASAPITIHAAALGDALVLSVHNVGAPIPAEDMRTIFQPFSRARAARASGVRGWGLGLSLVRACTEAHGGRVDVESGAGGTTFTVTLPLDARPFQRAETPADATATEAAPGGADSSR